MVAAQAPPIGLLCHIRTCVNVNVRLARHSLSTSVTMTTHLDNQLFRRKATKPWPWTAAKAPIIPCCYCHISIRISTWYHSWMVDCLQLLCYVGFFQKTVVFRQRCDFPMIPGLIWVPYVNHVLSTYMDVYTKNDALQLCLNKFLCTSDRKGWFWWGP
jgi:hypothetical protein